MSIHLNTDHVSQVLIGTIWHQVSNDAGTSTFEIDEAMIDDERSGQFWFKFRSPEDGLWIYGPLTSITAIESQGS